MNKTSKWFLYLLQCKGNRTYTGITNNLIERYYAHCQGKGAKFTRAFPPVEMIGWVEYPDKSAAAKAEASFRKRSRADKISMMTNLL